MTLFRNENVTSSPDHAQPELRFHEKYASAWFEYSNRSTGQRHQVWFNDPQCAPSTAPSMLAERWLVRSCPDLCFCGCVQGDSEEGWLRVRGGHARCLLLDGGRAIRRGRSGLGGCQGDVEGRHAAAGVCWRAGCARDRVTVRIACAKDVQDWMFRSVLSCRRCDPD